MVVAAAGRAVPRGRALCFRGVRRQSIDVGIDKI